MFRKTMMIVAPATFLFALPLAASAESMDKGALEKFASAALTIQQAGDAALKAHPGKLAAVTFGDENGRATYEAVVVGSDGQPWMLKIDAKTGEVFASGQSSAMQDDEDSAQDEGENGKDSETNDG